MYEHPESYVSPSASPKSILGKTGRLQRSPCSVDELHPSSTTLCGAASCLGRKRVRFNTQEDDLTLPSLYYYVIPAVEDEERDDVWWSSDSLDEIYYQHKAEATLQRTKRDIKDSIIFMMKSYKKEYTQNRKLIQEHVRASSISPFRGMESRIVSLISACRLRQRKVVLETVDECKLNGVWGTPHALHILRQRSADMSQPARQLGVLLGQADRIAADQVYGFGPKTQDRIEA